MAAGIDGKETSAPANTTTTMAMTAAATSSTQGTPKLDATEEPSGGDLQQQINDINDKLNISKNILRHIL